jgi:hypothetical protein
MTFQVPIDSDSLVQYKDAVNNNKSDDGRDDDKMTMDDER